MESVERPERGHRKLSFSLWGEQQEGDGPGEGAVSSSRKWGIFLEEVRLELGLSGVGSGAGGFWEQWELPACLGS